MSQSVPNSNGGIKVFQSGDISIGSQSVGGFGLNLQPCGYMYLNPSLYAAYNWLNLVATHHSLQVCNIVQGIAPAYDHKSWDRGDGWRYAKGGFMTGTDDRFCININDLQNPLDVVMRLHGVSYNLISDEEALSDSMTYIDKEGISHTVYVGGSKWDNRLSPDIIEQLSSELKWKHFGLMAQEVQKVLPEAVRTMPDNTLAVNYNAIIPYLIETIKYLYGDQNSLAVPGQSGRFLKNLSDNTIESTSMLFQNKPNPFSESTDIAYTLDNKVQNATIMLFDMQGTLLKTYDLDKTGHITIQSYEFKPGMYLYSLITDGAEIDTKRMILTN
ncbi:MAG: tail fiber domain-containing protein [Bacteroidales bacterium]|nr:tail fiber domain-containing protein [Bacteroidales bacterium]